MYAVLNAVQYVNDWNYLEGDAAQRLRQKANMRAVRWSLYRILSQKTFLNSRQEPNGSEGALKCRASS